MNINIRFMRKEDIEDVFLLEQRIFEDEWSLQSFYSELENPEVSIPLVVEEDKQIIGYAIVWYYADELHISNFAISPEYRRRGLGRRLLNYIMNLVSDYKFAYLEVRMSNRPAIALYEQYGFEPLYVRERYYRNGEDAVIMVKRNIK